VLPKEIGRRDTAEMREIITKERGKKKENQKGDIRGVCIRGMGWLG